MKIATLTYQRHDNYGAMLQCYALQKKLQSMGVETDVIDYVCEVSEHPLSLRALKSKGIKRYISGSIGAITRIPRKKCFCDFRKLIKMTHVVTEKNISQLGASYDGYIVGSDNVWNSDITGLDERYFLSFVADKRRRASYAASFGSSKLRDAQREDYKRMLSDFAILACRENSGAALIEELTGKHADVVCDPSILLSSDEWNAIAKTPKEKYPYLLAYQMVPSASFVKFVNEVATAKKLKVIFIPFPYGLIKCKTKPSIGPLEWLGLFKNAEFILTDSFHGCAFSAILNKQFAVSISQLGERIDNLLTILNIKERVVKTSSEVKALSDIDYGKVNQLLANFREKSEARLSEMLEYFKSLSSNGIVDPSQCTGCLSCQKICPKNAISTKRDTLGFVYPKINSDLCIKCGACERICETLVSSCDPVQKRIRKYYSALNYNTDVVKNSGSGGMFTALAELFVGENGCVYGAAYEEGFHIAHERVDSLKTIPHIRGTKYTQSTIANIYDLLFDDLASGKPVLFCGTPCQCAAVKAFLKAKKADCEKLYIVDIFCHGVFSPQIWKEYIDFLEKKFGEKITYVSFRDKSKGWRNKHLKITTDSKDISDYCNDNASVLRIYEQNLSLRESCYQCHYMNLERVGDISIGDFWGIERVSPESDKNTGISAVIVSTDKGALLVDKLRDRVIFNEFDEKDILQQVLREPTKKHSKRNCFICDYKDGGIERILTKYGQVKGKLKLKRDYIVPVLYKLRIAGLASKMLHINDN